jgi:hypothetical protein
MRKLTTFFALGLTFLLVACGATEASPVQAPVEAQESSAVEVAQPDTSNVAPDVAESVSEEMTAEEAVVQEEVIPEAEEPAPAVEASVPEKEAVSQEVTDQEKVMPDEVIVTHSGPTEEQLQLLDSLAIVGTPAELHNEVWLNSDPLKLADLRGKVVIIEFWTFG